VNFDKVFYLTDTGRKWDGDKVSVRDKVAQQEEWIDKALVFHSTDDIINGIEENRLPNQIMITMHPQRWHNNKFLWTKELILQNTKNIIKKYLFVKN